MISRGAVLAIIFAGISMPVAALESGDELNDCDGCPIMVVLPSGSFTMGTPETEPKREEDEQPQHLVTFAQPFAVSKFEITFDDWAACADAGGCDAYRPADEGWGRGTRPVIHVSWLDGQAYAAWLSETTGQSYRLMSEAEWEYAARAGTSTAYSFGEDENDLCDHANAADITLSETGQEGIFPLDCSDGHGRETAPVGTYQANPFGLHDMYGNVWEWVEDCWNETYDGAPTDGSAWATGDCAHGVLRSASYLDALGGSLRAGHRGHQPREVRYYNLGFRVARDIE